MPVESTTQIVKTIDEALAEIRSEAERLEAARRALRPNETANGRRRGRPPKNGQTTEGE